MPNVLIVGDTHFTSKPEDAYRFRLFRWLVECVREHEVEAVIFLGDLCDDKDRHPSVLVNELLDKFEYLARAVPDQVYVLMGNHDYVEPSRPFFKILNRVPKVVFVNELTVLRIGGGASVCFIPHSAVPKRSADEPQFWSHHLTNARYDVVVLHHTFNGAVTSSGFRMDGQEVPVLDKTVAWPDVFSGDIHKPQTLGLVTYVGTPYPVRFDDDFAHRVMLWKGRHRFEELELPTIRKVTISLHDPAELSAYGLRKHDQVKVRLHVGSGEVFGSTNATGDIRQIANKLGVYLAGIELVVMQDRRTPQDAFVSAQSPLDIVREFGEKEQLTDEYIRVGQSVIGGHDGVA